MDTREANQGSSGQAGSSGTPGSYGWLDDYNSGNYDNLPHDEIFSNYRDWSRTTSSDDLYEGTYRGYESLPEEQRTGLGGHLHSYTQERGIDLSDLELSSPEHSQWTTRDLARVTSRAYGYSDREEMAQPQGEKKEASGGGIPKPVLGLALAGALAFGASRLLGGKDDKDKGQDTPNYTGATTNSVRVNTDVRDTPIMRDGTYDTTVGGSDC